MMANFGTQIDYFEIATTDLILIASEKTPVADARVDAVDENGDIADKAYTGAGAIEDAKCTYSLITGTLDLSTLKLGELATGKIVSSIVVTPQAGECPKIEVTGQLGTEAVVAPAGKLNTFTLPAITISAVMAAQPIGFTVTAGKLQTVSFTASGPIAQDTKGDGDPAAHGFSGASMQVTCTLTATSSAVPAISAVSPFTIMQPLSIIEPTGGWRTGTATLDAPLTRDVSGS
jgi:hypothetical protein